MAEITYNYKDSKNDLNTYDGAVAALESIYLAIDHEFKGKKDIRISSSIKFESDDSQYVCDSLDDFKKHAFGKKITLTEITIRISNKEFFLPAILTISYDRFLSRKNGVFEYQIRSKDNVLIANIVGLLKKETDQTVYKTETHIDNSVHIGNGNQIVGSAIGQNNSVTTETPKSKKESLLSKISWEIVVPLVLAILGAVICAWFELKG